MLLNADGLLVRGCSADELILTQCSARPCIVEGSYFARGITITKEGNATVTSEII